MSKFWLKIKKSFILRPYTSLLAATVIGVLIGFWSSAKYWKAREADPITIKKLHPASNQYSLVNPLLGFDVSEKKQFLEDKSLEQKIISAISQAEQDGKISDIGVYFRDLENGSWSGVNESDQFAPGSVMKVQLLIAYYKQAELDPSVLNQTLIYDGKIDANAGEHFKSSNLISANKSYTISQLLSYMIVDSDNNAANLLLNHININSLNEIFSDLNLNLPGNTPNVEYLATPKQLSLIFRVLYNATYLPPDLANQALNLLTQTQFKDGLVAGIPTNISVAHKFGEREITDESTGVITNELHDCGIVYYPRHPYFLCIMTKGENTDLGHLADAIKNLSALVYNQVQNDNKK